MKQLIVLISTIVLGIAIAGMVMGLGDSAGELSDGVTSQIESLSNAFESYAE